MEKVKQEEVNEEVCRNVTFRVPESLISEIDAYCLEKGGLKRKEWFFDMLQEKENQELTTKFLMEENKSLKNKCNEYKFIQSTLEDGKLRIEKELVEMKKLYSDLFTSTLRYRTFFRRLINLFSNF